MSQMFQYEEWSPSAPDKLQTVDDFIDSDFTLKKVIKTKWENHTACVSVVSVRYW